MQVVGFKPSVGLPSGWFDLSTLNSAMVSLICDSNVGLRRLRGPCRFLAVLPHPHQSPRPGPGDFPLPNHRLSGHPSADITLCFL